MNVDRLIDELTLDEGVRLKPYRCTAGKLTIGIGRNLDDVGITRDEANYLLRNDIARMTKLLEQNQWFHTLGEARQVALANMAFNLGYAGLMSFKNMIAAIQRFDFDAAAKCALDSTWSKQVGKRAKRIAEQLRTGVYQ